jgi:hypothetical protein
MANPNLLTATSIYGNLFPNTINSVNLIVTTATFSNPSGSNKILNIKNIQISGNLRSATTVGGSYALIDCMNLNLFALTAAGSSQTILTTNVINKNTQFYLLEGQSIIFSLLGNNATIASTLNYLISYEEIS